MKFRRIAAASSGQKQSGKGIGQAWWRATGNRKGRMALTVAMFGMVGVAALWFGLPLLPSMTPPARPEIRAQRAAPSPTAPAASNSAGVGGSAATLANDWPMYGHDAARTNYNPNETILREDNVARLVSRWQVDIGIGSAPTSSAPSVSGGNIFVGSSSVDGPDFY